MKVGPIVAYTFAIYVGTPWNTQDPIETRSDFTSPNSISSSSTPTTAAASFGGPETPHACPCPGYRANY